MVFACRFLRIVFLRFIAAIILPLRVILDDILAKSDLDLIVNEAYFVLIVLYVELVLIANHLHLAGLHCPKVNVLGLCLYSTVLNCCILFFLVIFHALAH